MYANFVHFCSGVNKQGYSTIHSISAGMMNYSTGEKEVNVRKARTEDDYFNEDDDTGAKNLFLWYFP